MIYLSECDVEAEQNVETMRQKLKDDIDLRIESLKNHLDEIRDECWKDVDQICDDEIK